jgi:hypothetical protein
MRLRHIKIKYGLVLFLGWALILGTAAFTLPCTDSNVIAFAILGLTLVWFVLSVAALFFYFFRAWRRVSAVPNKAAYIAWLSVESAFALVAVAGIMWFFVSPS